MVLFAMAIFKMGKRGIYSGNIKLILFFGSNSRLQRQFLIKCIEPSCSNKVSNGL